MSELGFSKDNGNITWMVEFIMFSWFCLIMKINVYIRKFKHTYVCTYIVFKCF